jgi:pimeloyl-ACP methyl ester carboxylesterase
MAHHTSDCYFNSLKLFRGHGNTTTTDDSDLSAETMSNDIIDVIESIVSSRDSPNVDVILVGHSMGGALAVHAALQERQIGYLVDYFLLI